MSDLINNEKYGSIIKFSYKPAISTSLKSFCRTYVIQENSNEDTRQYPISGIFEEAEEMKYDILPSDKEILSWLCKENIEYIEI